jgi:glycosyltransferase involved in cell wall biosynthesis
MSPEAAHRARSAGALSLAHSGSARVSIITPSFNQVRWLADTIRSVAAQDYPDVEHIVMDGGSDDGSRELLAASPSVSVWRSEPDRGQSHALNKAFAATTGEIIGWLNSDDAYYDRNVLSAVVAEFERRPRVDVVYGHAALANASGLVLQALWAPPFNARLLRRTNFLIQPAVFVRRSVAGETLVDEQFQYSMDREAWLRLLEAGCRFRRIDRVIAIDRHWAGRKSSQRLDLAAVDRAELVRRYGVPSVDRRDIALNKLFTLTRRVAGVRLVRPLAAGRLAFDGRVDGWLQLLQRQLFLTRASMPAD